MRPTYATRLRLDPTRLPADTGDPLACVAAIVDRWFRGVLVPLVGADGHRVILPAAPSGPRGFATTDRHVHGRLDPHPTPDDTSWAGTYSRRAVQRWLSGSFTEIDEVVCIHLAREQDGGIAIEVQRGIDSLTAGFMEEPPGDTAPPGVLADLLATGAVVDGGISLPEGPLAAADPRLPAYLASPERRLPVLIVRHDERGVGREADHLAIDCLGLAVIVAGVAGDPGSSPYQLVWPDAAPVDGRMVERRWRAPLAVGARISPGAGAIAPALLGRPLAPWHRPMVRAPLAITATAARFRHPGGAAYPAPLTYADALASWREGIDAALFAAITAHGKKPFDRDRLDAFRRVIATTIAREEAGRPARAIRAATGQITAATLSPTPDDPPAAVIAPSSPPGTPAPILADDPPVAAPRTLPSAPAPAPATTLAPPPPPETLLAEDAAAPIDEPLPPTQAGGQSTLGRIGRDLSLFARGLETLLDFDLEVQALAGRVVAAETEVLRLQEANARLTRELDDVKMIAAHGQGPLARRFASLREVLAFVASEHEPAVLHVHQRAYAAAERATFGGSLLRAWEALEHVSTIAEAFHTGWLTSDPRGAFQAAGGVYAAEIARSALTAHPEACHVPWPEPDGPRRALGPLLGVLRDDAGEPTLWIAWFKETAPHRRYVIGHVGDRLPGRG